MAEIAEKLVELRELITKNVNTRDEKFADLDTKIDDYISNINKISQDTEAKIESSISEISDLKSEIKKLSKQFSGKKTNLSEEISLQLQNVDKSVNELLESVKGKTPSDLSQNSENIDMNIDKLLELIENSQSDSKSDTKEIKDKITAVKQEVNLVNTDIIDTLNSKAEAIILELKPLKQYFESIISNIQLNPVSPEVQNSVMSVKNVIDNTLTEQLVQVGTSIEDIKVSQNNISKLLDTLNEKIENLAVGTDSSLIDEIDEVKTLIFEQKNAISQSDNTDKISKIQNSLEELVKKIDSINSNDLNEMKESVISAVLNVFEQISFIEESEDIKDFVEEKTDELSQSLTEVKRQLKQLSATDENEDYTYTLQDIESDIAKLRLVLNEMSSSSTNDEIYDISKNINRIAASVEEMQNSLTQEQLNELKSNLDKLSEDVVSISSRTNKLLLSSDESYRSLTDNLSDFNNIISQKVEQKLDNVISTLSQNVDSDKVMRQVFTYLGEWIDNASENFDNLNKQTDKINDVQEVITNMQGEFPQYREQLNVISDKFEEQEARIDRLELKLEKILSVLDNIDDTKLTRKIDKIDKQIANLSKNVEKLTSYVDE